MGLVFGPEGLGGSRLPALGLPEDRTGGQIEQA